MLPIARKYIYIYMSSFPIFDLQTKLRVHPVISHVHHLIGGFDALIVVNACYPKYDGQKEKTMPNNSNSKPTVFFSFTNNNIVEIVEIVETKQ